MARTVKRLYHSPCNHAAVYLKALGDGDWEVETVITDSGFRRQGLQREIWARVTADADAEGAHLLLTVGDGGAPWLGALDHRQLWDWYDRLGFYGLAGRRMERPPHYG